MLTLSWSSIRSQLQAGVLLLALSACTTDEHQREPEIYVLPDHYVGSFRIIFNAANGEAPLYENNSRVHIIPSNGVLLTQMGANEGWIDEDLIQFFYQKADGARTKITNRWTTSFADNQEHRADTTTYVFGGGIGVYEDGLTIPCIITSTDFYIGTKTNVLDDANFFNTSDAIEKVDEIDCTNMEPSPLYYHNLRRQKLLEAEQH